MVFSNHENCPPFPRVLALQPGVRAWRPAPRPARNRWRQNDPWEATNRDIFAFNVWVEHNVAAPVVDVYRAVVPQPARDGVHNAVTNLHAPIVLANDMLQAPAQKGGADHGARRASIPPSAWAG